MSFEAGVSLEQDAEAVIDAADALSEGNLDDTEVFDRAAQVVTAMHEHGENMREEGELEAPDDEADEAINRLERVVNGLETLADGDEPEDLEWVEGEVGGIAGAYARRVMEVQFAAALGL